MERDAPAHHRPGGGFRNPWPDSEVQGWPGLFKWKFRDSLFARLEPDPPFGSFPTSAPRIAVPRAAAGQRSVTWIGHSTVLVQLPGLNVLTDPVWGERASFVSWAGPKRVMPPGVPFESLPPIDVVLLSHNHYDHLDAGTVRRIAARFPGAKWCAPLGLSPLLREFGVGEIAEADWWGSVTGDGWTATATPARHFSARGFGDRGDTLWCGWTLHTADARFYFAGDTALHPQFGEIASRLGPFDLVMLPIGAYEPRWFMKTVHMNPEDTIEAYRAIVGALGGRTPPSLALHWGTFRLTDEPMNEPPERFARLWREAGFPLDSNWTLAFGETRAW